MCLFLQFSERERFHTKLSTFLSTKKKRKEEEKAWWKKSTSPPLLVTRLRIRVKRACVYTRGDVTTTAKLCFGEIRGSTLFYLGFTSDTLNKTSYGRRQKEEEDDTNKALERRARGGGGRAFAGLVGGRKSLSLSLFLSSSSKSSSAYSVRERYTR